MSAQFGKWNLDGMPNDADYLRRARDMISAYGPDGEGFYTRHNIAFAHSAFHTTKESRSERQPHVSASGAVVTWDGRLDNRSELISRLGDVLTADATDLEIAAAAYDRWGTDCFPKLIGDWALSVWNPDSRTLVLAKDPMGTRHLYYSADRDQIAWSSILDPLVLLAEKTLRLNEEYIAGCLSLFPAAHLTPYEGIHAVPPSCFIEVRPGACTVRKYWDFDPCKRILYATDGQYEDHFRAVFGEAIRRRLRSDSPVLAELSGGMDSSSIVCMTDAIFSGRDGQTPRLDTVSYYDDGEPNWDERPYFSKVEEKRGRTGWHIDISRQEPFNFDSEAQKFAATPGSVGGVGESSRQYSSCLSSNGNRVVLSGIGGDEVMGGVPTPIPELEDLLAKWQFSVLARQLNVWSLQQRKPWIHLFFETVRGFLPSAQLRVAKHRRPPSWLNAGFIRRNRIALQGYDERLELFGPLPSFQENLSTLEALRRQLACTGPLVEPLYEKRYPYLDRGLLEFIFAIPREQLVRPGQRRSLMRRALVGIVPDEVLHRKRKAFVVRRPLASIYAQSSALMQLSRNMSSAALGIVDWELFAEALRMAGQGKETSLVPLIRILGIEFWLRNLASSGLTGQNRAEARGNVFNNDPLRPVSS